MKVKVTFRHMEPEEGLREYVEEKVVRLCDKYFHRPHEASVVLTAEKFRRIAEILIRVDNTVLNGREEQEDARSAVDLVLDKLEIQARKYRSRFKPRKRGAESGIPAEAAGPAEEEEEEEAGPQLIREDSYLSKPISLDDAILALEESEKPLVVFRNAQNMEICVLYRRPDGNYGLIETKE